jgi:F-type H+-transporting ATPase subunit gamma
MSGNLQTLRRRIDGARDLEQVVRSMKAMAASSIGQYEKAVQSLNAYYRTVELGLVAVFHHGVPMPMADAAATLANGAIVIGSDQGLVGGFNDVLGDFALHALAAMPGKTMKIWAVGERMQALMTDARPDAVSGLSVPSSASGITRLVDQLLIDIEAARERHDVVQIHVFHNRPKSGAIYEPVGRQLLPLDRQWSVAFARLPWPAKNLPQVIGPAAPVLHALVREYLFVLLYQACAESLASENASRLAAMQRAEKNIGEMLDAMNSRYRRLRQDSIDEELFDLVSGYEALSKNS